MSSVFRLSAAKRLAVVICAAALAVSLFPVEPSVARHRGVAHAIVNELLREQRRERVYVVPKPVILRAEIAEAQRILNMIGYNAGAVDGAMGRRTRTALVLFQRDNGLRRTGTANRTTMAALRRAEAVHLAGRQPARVQPAQPAEPQPQVRSASVNAGDVSGLYCAGDDSLALNELDNGDLQFMVNSAQSGHLCSAEGTARRTPYGWRFEAGMRGESFERCALEISADGAVRLSTDADARCQAQCGARATLNGLAFSGSARVTAIPAARLFENDGELFRESCGS